MLSLAHLVISTVEDNFTILSKTLPQFSLLKSLFLGGTPGSNANSSLKLHLEGLRELRSVALNRLVPVSIQLRESCKLHVHMTGRRRPLICGLCPHAQQNL